MVALATLLAACSGAAESDTGERTSRTQSALTALTREAQSVGASLSWKEHPSLSSRANHLHIASQRWALPAGTSVDARALSFLDLHAESIGIPSPATHLVRQARSIDSRGTTHLRFKQTIGGVEVVGGELVMHISEEGDLRSLDAHLVPAREDSLAEATISGARAEVNARERVRTLFNEDAVLRITSNDLVLLDSHGSLEPTFRVLVDVSSSRPASMQIDVSAATGDIVGELDILQTVTGGGVGALGDKRELSVLQSGTSFQMIDRSRGSEIDTYSANQGTSVPGKLISSTTKDAWDTTATAGAGAAVDAHFFAGVVYDYYKLHHARKGIDGNDGAMISSVHFGVQYDNAFWSPTAKQMGYGDGGMDLRPLPAALDVVAHEFTHRVTQASAKLTYQNESGALNEAVSDIFAAFIEHSFKPDETKNFLVGEVIGKNGPLRDMAHPASPTLQYPQPSHMSEYVVTQQDNGGIHINSSIPNNAMVLMTVGGVNDVSKIAVPRGLGWEKAEKLWYHALTNYFMASDDFVAAANQTIEAATDLGFAESDRNVVECAWISVGVLSGECKSTDPGADPQTAVTDPAARPNADESDAGTGPTGPINLRAGKGDTDCAMTQGPSHGTPVSCVAGALLTALAIIRRKRQRAS